MDVLFKPRGGYDEKQNCLATAFGRFQVTLFWNQSFGGDADAHEAGRMFSAAAMRASIFFDCADVYPMHG